MCSNLKAVYLPYSVKSVGDSAFESCSALESVYLDESVYTSNGTNAFKSCAKAKFFYLVYATKGLEVNVDGLQYKVTNASKDGSGTVELVKYTGSNAAVSVPYSIRIYDCIYKVTKIDKKAFYNNSTITTLSIGSAVSTIGDEAFRYCANLTSVSGGKGLTTLGKRSFANCTSLNSFAVASKKLKKIGYYEFSGDKLLKLININKTTKLTKAGVKKSLKSSSVKTVKVKKAKVKLYKKYFVKKNSGKKVTVKK